MKRVFRLLDMFLLAVVVFGVGFVIFMLLNHETQLYSRSRVVILIWLPLIFVTGLIISFQLSQELRGNIAVVLFSIGTSLYLAEFTLTLVSWYGETHYLPRDSDRRSKFEVVRDMRASGINAYPAYSAADVPTPLLPVAADRISPMAGVKNAVTVVCNELGRYLIYESDEMGFPNPKGLWGIGNIEIGIIGDSFAQGYCVAFQDSFASLIRDRYPRTLNLGAGGHGPLLEFAMLREYLVDIKPSIVLWLYTDINDMWDLEMEMQNKVFIKYLNDTNFRQKLMVNSAKIDEALRSYIDTNIIEYRNGDREEYIRQEVTRCVKLARIRAVIGLSFKTQLDPGVVPAFEYILREANKVVEKWGGRFYFVYLPSYESVTHNTNAILLDHDSVLSITRELGIRTIDLYPAFLSHPDPLSLFPFRRRNHYNAAGYRLVADHVLRVLKEARSEDGH